jgi:ribosomal protein L11 methyltransferase
MSFGTGHHETTHMMIPNIYYGCYRNENTDMRYSNFGYSCRNEGAQPIDAIDIDNWCYLNSIENAERNNCHQITVMKVMHC